MGEFCYGLSLPGDFCRVGGNSKAVSDRLVQIWPPGVITRSCPEKNKNKVNQGCFLLMHVVVLLIFNLGNVPDSVVSL